MSPRTEEQFEKMRLSSRSRIMNAALVLFVEKGVHKTTTAMIAKEAGVSTGLMYNYFKSKDELIIEMVRESLAMGRRGLKAIMEIEDPAAFLRRFANGLKIIRDEKKHLVASKFDHMMKVQADAHPDIKEITKEFHEETLAVIEDQFRRLGRENPDLLARAYSAMLTGIRVQFISLGPEYPLGELVDMTKEIFTGSV